MRWREERRKGKKINFMDRVYRCTCRYNVRYLETGMGGGGGGG